MVGVPAVHLLSASSDHGMCRAAAVNALLGCLCLHGCPMICADVKRLPQATPFHMKRKFVDRSGLEMQGKAVLQELE